MSELKTSKKRLMFTVKMLFLRFSKLYQSIQAHFMKSSRYSKKKVATN